jgi:hypothetical protein
VELATFLKAFDCWARAQIDIAGVVLVGSHARDTAHEESDVDLIILTSEVDKYLQDQLWLSQFGVVQECEIENWGQVTSLRVFYKDRTEVEYNFSTPDWASVPVDAGTYHVVADGMKIIHDPQRILKVLQETVSSGRG